MRHGIYKMTEAAIKANMDWDKAIYKGEIEYVEEFETYDEAVAAYENGGYDSDEYGCC